MDDRNTAASDDESVRVTEASEGGQRTTYSEILTRQIESGLRELERPTDGLFISGLSAGLDIGFGPLLMAIMLTLVTGVYEKPVVEILTANMYAVGFVFVVLGQSELFTEHTTLAILPVLDGQASLSQLGRLWGLVYAANLVGGGIFVLLVVPFAPKLGVAEPAAFAKIATGLTEHAWLTLAVAAVLAGWLMGLLSWLVAAAQDTISRIVIVWIITAVIGFAHLPHSIAGNVEVLAGLVATSEITVVDYLWFQSAATVGNVVGGAIFVALIKYSHVVRGGSVAPDENHDPE